MALTDVPAGHLAAIVTSLEMTERPAPAPPAPAALKLEHWRDVDLDRYRDLFRAVGHDWLWFSRLTLDDTALAAIVHDPRVEVRAACRRNGEAVGLLELDFRQPHETELSFFGLLPAMTGRGFGGWLMREALRLAWRADTRRVWVHSCTLDDPRALGFYRHFGFKPYRRQVETFPDPRLTGHLPRDAAPGLPCIG